MNKIDVLVKCITLLYREREIGITNDGGGSKDLVLNTLARIEESDKLSGIMDNARLLDSLRKIVSDMCDESNDELYDSTSLLQSIKIITKGNDNVYEAVEKGITTQMSQSSIKRMIVNTRRSLTNYFREQELGELLKKSNYLFNHKRSELPSTNEFISSLITQLESLELQKSSKDKAITSEIDIGDKTSLDTIFREIKDGMSEESIMVTGWKKLNRMLQGGFRRGEFIVVPALQHKYKTGFTLSMFCQIALFNKPYMINNAKKPLIVRISFEDDITNNIQFVYMYLKGNEDRNYDPKNDDVSTEEMSSYIKEKLSVNGYQIKMLRVNPTDWTYRHITNTLLSLEAEGYEIHLLMLDYLSMVPTTGCNTSGPTGTDMRDMFRRIRNFCGPKKITVVTPHQISPQGKQLLRSGIPNESFVKEVSEKGYYSGSSQLDQEVDLEIYIHLAYVKKRWYLTVQRGKHRLPTNVNEKYKYFLLPFDRRELPIQHDYDREFELGYYKTSEIEGSGSDSIDF